MPVNTWTLCELRFKLQMTSNTRESLKRTYSGRNLEISTIFEQNLENWPFIKQAIQILNSAKLIKRTKKSFDQGASCSKKILGHFLELKFFPAFKGRRLHPRREICAEGVFTKSIVVRSPSTRVHRTNRTAQWARLLIWNLPLTDDLLD